MENAQHSSVMVHAQCSKLPCAFQPLFSSKTRFSYHINTPKNIYFSLCKRNNHERIFFSLFVVFVAKKKYFARKEKLNQIVQQQQFAFAKKQKCNIYGDNKEKWNNKIKQNIVSRHKINIRKCGSIPEELKKEYMELQCLFKIRISISEGKKQ